MNNLKTGFLLTLLSVLFVWLGFALGGQTGALIALGFAAVMNIGSYWLSDKLVLRIYKAREVTEAEAPELYGVVADLAQRAGLPMPRVCIIPQPGLNAFATGRNPAHAAVAVTEGLLAHMDRAELSGVIAHELSHVKHRDILIGSVAATLAAAISVAGSMARWGAIFGDDRRGGSILVVFAISMLAGLAAMLVQMAISRSREFEADAGAARLLGDPNPLISALRKLDVAAERLPLQANQATAHMMIVNPLRGGGIARMFSTHPNTEERIARLQGLVGIPNF
jgi:heat shock protein HtpX